MAMAILGMGTALPAYSIAQQDSAGFAKALCCINERQSHLLETLYKRTRIRRRASVLLRAGNGSAPEQDFFSPQKDASGKGPTTQVRMQRYAQEAAPLALVAAAKALRQSGLAASRITHLITVSCTGFAAPGVDIGLVKQLGLRTDVGRMHVGFMGCHGVINGLRIAEALATSNPASRVLLCAVELCSLHFAYGWDPANIVANGLFADGAAALVGACETKRNANGLRVKAIGSFIFPDSEDAMTWRIGDHGFEMTLSNRVPALITKHLGPLLRAWLGKQRTSIEKIRSWAVHPGGPRLIDEVAARLDLPEPMLAASRDVLAECGNMSSPTLLFILERLQLAGAPRPCLMLGFGPGLVAEMALLN